MPIFEIQTHIDFYNMLGCRTRTTWSIGEGGKDNIGRRYRRCDGGRLCGTGLEM